MYTSEHSSPVLPPSWSQPPRLLVVDDDPTVREIVAEVLADEGYAVARAGDGATALKLVDTLQPDVVVSDVMLPRLDGLQLAHHLQAKGIAVILMSAGSAPLKAGAHFLAKPFDLDDLVAAVSRVLPHTLRGHSRPYPSIAD